MPDKLDKQTLANRYGFNLAFFKSHPGLFDLFSKAWKQNWSDEEFIARLRGTDWFKNHSDTARQFIVLRATDPTTAEQRIRQRQANVEQMAGAFGVSGLNAKEAEHLAERSLLLGWDDAQLRDHLAKAYDYNPEGRRGGGVSATTVKRIADDYLVPMSDRAIQKWTREIIAGTTTEDDFRSWAQTQASSLMPALADRLKGGMTVRDLLDPYAQIAEQLLGISADTIDFTKNKWRKAVDVVDDKGERQVMSLTDWETTLKSDEKYGFRKSAAGREVAADFATEFAKMFGMVG